MAEKEVVWYELIGREGVSPQLLVRCDCFAAALSLEELLPVEISCPVPMTRFHWELVDREERPVDGGDRPFAPEGVERFTLGQVLPVDALRPYETEHADYSLVTGVTLANGHRVKGSFCFRCFLHRGKQAETAPQQDLQSALARIPVANAGMTGAQLRQICLEYMKLQLEFPFRMQEDFLYTIESQLRLRRLVGGKVYGGIPYVSRGAGNLYRIAEAYDPATGYLDRQSDIFRDIRCFGNACSGSASMAWARVVTSAYLGYTMFMTQVNGFLPVGDYRYPVEELTRFSLEDISCRTVCDFNGPGVMYEAYARVQPADGIVCDGHVRMVGFLPQVIRGADGAVDPDRSSLRTLEQNCYVSSPVNLRLGDDGTHYTAQGYIGKSYSFRTLFEGGYLPFTFREFADPSLVEPARLRLAVEPELRDRVLSANYPISDVFARLGERRWTYRNMEFFRKELKLGDIFPAEALTEETELSCRLLNGQLLDIRK